MKRQTAWLLGLVLISIAGCQSNEPQEDASTPATGSVTYQPVISEPRWIVPGDNLPPEVLVHESNNNVSIQVFNNRLFVSWRTGPTHFASKDTLIHIISSEDNGKTWEFEATFAMETDLREPLLYVAKGQLFFTFFQGGTEMLGFDPKAMWRSVRKGMGNWSEAVEWGEPKEVPWEVVAHDDKLYLTTYLGSHYKLTEKSAVDVRFFVSDDGENWSAVNGDNPVVYSGGASEAAFHFDSQGDLWAVLRNEDGDETGFG